MAGSSAVSGFGAIFNWNTVDMPEAISISGPSEGMDPIEVTHYTSDDVYREFIAGLRDGGEISVEFNWLPEDTDQEDLHVDFQAGTKRAFKIKLPGWVATTHEYPEIDGEGFITSWNPSYPFDDKMTLAITVRTTGKPVLSIS